MVREQVEKTMKKALNKYAEKEGTDPSNIAFFIHTKPNEADPTLAPKYFYSVNGQTVMGEDGKLLDLRFTQDILGKKFDLLGMEAMAEQFLSQYFKRISKEVDATPNSLYVSISADPKWTNKLRFMLIKNGSELLKCSDYNEKEEIECSEAEWEAFIAEKAEYSKEEWRERVRASYSLKEIFGE